MTTEAPTADKYVSTDDEFSVDARPSQATAASTIASGWEAAESLHAPAGDYPVDFKHSEEFQLVKFIDQNGPFASYKQHFLTKSGRRSYVCLGNNCPLCMMLGDRPEDKRAFTVVNLTGGNVQRQQLIATPRLYKTLHAAEFSPQGPLKGSADKPVFWALNRTGQKQQTVYNIMAVKARDLQEDWGIDLDAISAQITAIQPYDRSVIKESTHAELLEIANELA